MDLKEVKELLRNYRLGRCSPKEREIIDQWFDSIHYPQEQLSEEGLLVLKQKMQLRIKSRINNHEAVVESNSASFKKIKRYNLSEIRKVAAVLIVVLFVIGVGIYKLTYFEKLNSSIEDITLGVSKIHLSDGSVVWLKNDSELEYPEKFIGGQREVYLSGEAFFDVVKDPKKPFIIHSKNMTTKVLGTSFNIRAYDHEESKEVEVVTGSVLVSVNQGKGKLKEVLLNPRQKIIYNQKENLIIEEPANEMNSSAGVDPLIELKFVEMSLNEIIARISQKFDVTIEIKNDQINNCKITADLSGEPLDHCLEIIAQATNSKYIILENKITIDGNGCNN